MQTPSTKHQTLNSTLKERANELGFALVGIAPATVADGFARFGAWLDRGFAGEMAYLPNLRDERQHPRSILESVRSVVMVGLEYCGLRIAYCGTENQEYQSIPPTSSSAFIPNSEFRIPNSRGKVAAYAAGPDYHRIMWDRLNTLALWLREQEPDCKTRAVTDTAPLLERDFARRAGLGWVGKNTMLINTRRGSFFFLGALLTDLELEPDSPTTGPHCGTCTACLDACPTQAFPQPFVLDATKCISYLTIELRSTIPLELREPMGNWLYGCDVCQDVCPWNRNASERMTTFPHAPDMEYLDPVELLGLDSNAFRARFKQTALWRNRRVGLLRNAAIVLGNIGDESAIPALEKALSDEDLIRDAAQWAINRICQRISSVNSGLPK